MPFPQPSYFFYKRRGRQVFLGAEWACVIRGWIWFSPSLISLSICLILSFTSKAMIKRVCTQLGYEKGKETEISNHTGLWSEAFKASKQIWCFHSVSTYHQLALTAICFLLFLSDFQQNFPVPHKTHYLPGQGLAGVSHSQMINWCNYCFSAFLGLLVILKHLGCPNFFFFYSKWDNCQKTGLHTCCICSQSSVMTVGFLLQKFFRRLGCSATQLEGFSLLHWKSSLLHQIHTDKNLLLAQ